MKKENLTISFSAGQSPQQAFDAINNARGWWSGKIDGDTDKLVQSSPTNTKMCTAPNRKSPN